MTQQDTWNFSDRWWTQNSGLEKGLIRRQAILRFAWGVQKTCQQEWEPDPDTRYVFWGETAGAGPNAFATIDERGKSSGPLVLIMLQTNNASKVAVAAKATPASPATAAFSLNERQWQGRKNSRSSASSGLQSNVLYWTCKICAFDWQAVLLWLHIGPFWQPRARSQSQRKLRWELTRADNGQLTVVVSRFALRPAPWMAARAVFAKAMWLNKAQQNTRDLCGWTVIRSFQMSTLARTVRVLRQNLL